ncbi:DUF1449 domain-containing protein [Gynuella sp.]|uniref:DUF1449 domain-containing protein n=1 Tax=Gynuella sp. TaxID=2969146 RepID=UPI003D109840
MFAIFLSSKMDPFYQNIGSFPTVIFTFFLGVSLCFWLIAVLGLVDLDVADIDVDLPEGNGSAEGADVNMSLAGILSRFGLHGVPLTIVISLLSWFGWVISYLAVHYILNPVASQGFVHYLLGLVIFLGSLYLASIPSALIIRPLRKIFSDPYQDMAKHLTGQIAVVRTSRVDATFGEAFFNDGGAGLILKVRSMNDETFVKGDRVVLLEYVEAQNIFRVISEHEFNGVLKQPTHH